MRKLIALFFALCLVAPASAYWQSRDSTYNKSVGAPPPAYVGPLDISGYTTAYAYWGLRCASTSYTGNVADVWDQSTGTTTHTLLTCSSGGVINETINPLSVTCASGCGIATLYDQSGNSRDMNFASIFLSIRPPLVRSGVGNSGWAMFCNGQTTGDTYLTTASNATAQAQPFTVSAILRNNTFSSGGILLSDGTFSIQNMVTFGAGTISQYFGVRQDYTSVADNSWASLQSVANGASSSMSVNGTITTAPGSPGTNGIGSTNKLTLCAGTDTGSAPLNGYVSEVIVIAGAVSTANQALMTANQRAYGGF